MKIFTKFTTKVDETMKGNSKNRRSFLAKNGLENKKDIVMNLVHGSDVCVVNNDYIPQNCDALITDRADVALFVHVADCMPVLMFDPDKEVIAVVHAGRHGVFQDIIEKIIQKFQSEYASRVSDIHVAIGPSAQKCCYEVGKETNKHLDLVRQNYGSEFIHGLHIDLPAILIQQLIDKGIQKQHIQSSSICTMCSGNEYYSFRNGDSERFAGVIALT